MIVVPITLIFLVKSVGMYLAFFCYISFDISPTYNNYYRSDQKFENQYHPNCWNWPSTTGNCNLILVNYSFHDVFSFRGATYYDLFLIIAPMWDQIKQQLFQCWWKSNEWYTSSQLPQVWAEKIKYGKNINAGWNRSFTTTTR